MGISRRHREPHPLRLARLNKGWTQQNLADLLGVSALEVGRWERGEASPHPLYRERLCELFESTAEQLGIQRPTSKDAGLPHDTHFLLNEPPSTPEDFYGREHERHRLIVRTRKKASTSIVGP